MIWSALVPLKPAARKGRLAERLSPEQRNALSHALFECTVASLRGVAAVRAIYLLSDAKPVNWTDEWICDEGRGLNPEIEAARVKIGPAPLLVIHADLPLVQTADIAALLDHARKGGVAIAADRHGEGTNAIALANSQAFRFAFGIGSLARHRAQAGDAACVERAGLALDCDTPDDLDRAIAGGFALPWTTHI